MTSVQQDPSRFRIPLQARILQQLARTNSFLRTPLQIGGSFLGREYAFVDSAGLLNETRAIEVALRDELYNFAHFAHHSRKIPRKPLMNDGPHPLTRGSGPAALKYLRRSQVVFSGRHGVYGKSTSGRAQQKCLMPCFFCITVRTPGGEAGGDTGTTIGAPCLTCRRRHLRLRPLRRQPVWTFRDPCPQRRVRQARNRKFPDSLSSNRSLASRALERSPSANDVSGRPYAEAPLFCLGEPAQARPVRRRRERRLKVR